MPVEPTTWIRASAKDAALVRDVGVRETGMLASASDYHTFYKFTAMWSSQEGSLLLWAWVLSLTSSAVLFATRNKHRECLKSVRWSCHPTAPRVIPRAITICCICVVPSYNLNSLTSR